MKTILAIDLGKRNSVFCKLNTSSLKSEYLTAKTDPQRSHDIFADLDIKNSIFSKPDHKAWTTLSRQSQRHRYCRPGLFAAPPVPP